MRNRAANTVHLVGTRTLYLSEKGSLYQAVTYYEQVRTNERYPEGIELALNAEEVSRLRSRDRNFQNYFPVDVFRPSPAPLLAPDFCYLLINRTIEEIRKVDGEADKLISERKIEDVIIFLTD